ncbi:hypothetical protein [Pseudomonas syringae group genomosp. 3]|uniref:Uncharacterized protein n=1 Tax=Pseudomonas syringae pv. coriandricola TaxID=264453 RepID=A0A3M3JSY5_9PSED|nr:hypothetical protein [Pseudomonas syringae group genomosp. 3]RMN13966.1 hypothetical protein ALQ65_200002 [Pseudomonas syringae pv. coriandricola]
MNNAGIYYLFAFLALGAAYAGIFLWVPEGRSSAIRYSFGALFVALSTFACIKLQIL